jgi:hypothetical protein
MNRSFSKIRHIQEANQKLEKRIMCEQDDFKFEFDPTKKGSSEPKKSQFINPNKEAFEKIKGALIAFKKPSKVDTVVFNGVPYTDVEYTDYTWDRSPTGAPKRTYNLSISDHGNIMLFAGTPEIKQIGKEMGLVPIQDGSETLYTKWNETDLNSSIEKVKNFLRNPKIRVAYDGVIK